MKDPFLQHIDEIINDNDEPKVSKQISKDLKFFRHESILLKVYPKLLENHVRNQKDKLYNFL
jgi:hypothetical protein